jgi:hypothetical protein
VAAVHEQVAGLNVALMLDATEVAAEGQRIEREGVPYVVDGMIPAFGMLGLLVGYAKSGKTAFSLALGAAVSAGQPFLNRLTRQVRVLVIAAEDPPEYTAHLARHLGTLLPGSLTFYRGPLVLDDIGLEQIAATVRMGRYGLVLIASWQAVVRGLIKDENDNVGAVKVVEQVKTYARQTHVPWLIDAHSGKGEDQTDDADPAKAIRGASAAAASADFLLLLRYASRSAFGTRRRLSGKGRFVALAPFTLDYDVPTGRFFMVGASNDVSTDDTWRLIVENGALTHTPQSAAEIAIAAGVAPTGSKPNATHRRQVQQTLENRPGVSVSSEKRRGQETKLYSLKDRTIDDRAAAAPAQSGASQG